MRPKSYSNLSESVSKYVENLLNVDANENLQVVLQLAKKKGLLRYRLFQQMVVL